MNTLEVEALRAERERIWSHAVAVGNEALKSWGTDPFDSELRARENSKTGTGVAGTWAGHYFVATAKHVIENAELKDLYFYVRAKGSFDYKSTADFKFEDAKRPVHIGSDDGKIFRCEWEDLAVIELTRRTVLGPLLEFFDFQHSVRPRVGEIIKGLGYPVDKPIVLTKIGTSYPIQKTAVLSPEEFTATVLPSSKGKYFKEFNPDNHFLIDYHPAARGHHPDGISGAAVWGADRSKQIIWAANFKFAGICTSCYRNGKFEQVVKAKAVQKFLKEIF